MNSEPVLQMFQSIDFLELIDAWDTERYQDILVEGVYFESFL